MISRPAGWSWHVKRSGIRLAADDGTVIRYVERARPLRTAVAIVEDLIGGACPTPHRFVSDEGEYGAFVRLEQRTIALLFGDDFYALLDGAGPSHALVEDLARTDVHLLGLRRRRFWYAPPSGWQGFLSGPFHAHWLAPGYPRDPARLFVLPALPGVSAAAVRAALAVDASSRQPIVVGELAGELHEIGERRLLVLADAHFVYPIELVDPHERHRSVLDELARTIEPIPVPGASRATGLGWLVW